MKNTLLQILLIIGFPLLAYSQELSYNSTFVSSISRTETPGSSYFIFTTSNDHNKILEEVKTINETEFRKHSLGDEIAKRLFLFDRTYTYESEPAPGTFTGQRVIKKPVIYHSIYKIEKFYRKKIKSQEISEDAAKRELITIIDLALIIFDLNTSEFESVLKDSDNERDMISTFKRVKIEPY